MCLKISMYFQITKGLQCLIGVLPASMHLMLLKRKVFCCVRMVYDFYEFSNNKTGRMMSNLREQRMCPFCLNKHTGDEHHYIFKCTHPRFIPIQTKLFEAIFELADWNTYSYE